MQLNPFFSHYSYNPTFQNLEIYLKRILQTCKFISKELILYLQRFPCLLKWSLANSLRVTDMVQQNESDVYIINSEISMLLKL